MRLKSIEILGFKSFADKVKLEFQSGITAVVGPNGCGKSNIADAFRWVLGEQSAKSMRGIKMPDVIFAGTTTRKPLNFAEVTITMADVEGMLPTDYEEISVTRRLHRSGDSEYFLNRHPVRLKDVQSLFLDSGIGKDAYSIFEQGKMEQIINFTPLERRYIFEEAAGILRFLHRKGEALKKLEQSDLNISRVKDIHQEVEKQIVFLEKQAEKALFFKQKKIELERLEKMLLAAKWRDSQKRSLEGQKKGEDLKLQLEQMNSQLEALQNKLQQAKAFCAEGEKILKTRWEEVYKTRSDKEIKTREKQAAMESMKEAVAREKRWQLELDSLQEKRKARVAEQTQAQKQLKNTEGELAQQESVLKEVRAHVYTLEANVSRLRLQQQSTQQELLKVTQEESRNESELKQCAIRLESSQERHEQILEKQNKIGEHLQELTRQSEEKNRQNKEISLQVEDQRKKFSKLEKEQAELMEAIDQSQRHLDMIHKEITEINARHKVLKKLKEEMEGFSAGTKRLLMEAENVKSSLFQKLKGLYEFISPNEGAEAVIAAVMKPYAQTLVVLTEKDLHAVLLFARQHHLNDFSLICLEHVEARETDLATLLERAVPNEISRHFLSGIQVTTEISTALQLVKQGWEIWIEEGVLVDAHRVIVQTSPSEKNVFMREAELKSLDKRLEELECSKKELEITTKSFQQRKGQLQNERIDLDKVIRKNEMKLVEYNISLQRLHGDHEKAKLETKFQEEELKKAGIIIEQLAVSLKELKEKHAQAVDKKREIQNAARSVSAEVEQQTATLKLEQIQLHEKEAVLHKVTEEQRKVQHALHVIQVKDLESLQQEKRLEEEFKSNRELQDKFKQQSADFEQVIQCVEKMLAESLAATKEFEIEVARRGAVIENLEMKIQEARNRQKKLENEYAQAEMDTKQAVASMKTQGEELQERFRLSIEEAAHLPWEEFTENHIKTLRHEIESAGDINMTAIEEFEKHKARYDFLNTQIDDLNLSKQELVQIIAQLSTESRKIFRETFDKIQANFRKNFKILFNGGEADLQFTETADLLEAGIEIIAKPPGKQMRSIHLLSGGEKCLTAMALLFALFEVKPAPYCILDEIDAPLDDTNIERFVNVLKQFIDHCQFIIITHNKRTMAIADRLFGVSMEEKGVSKLLTMEFADSPIVSV